VNDSVPESRHRTCVGGKRRVEDAGPFERVEWLSVSVSGLVCLAFHVMIDGEERGGVLALEYGALGFAMWSESRRTKGG
jgi:hypothetical protein